MDFYKGKGFWIEGHDPVLDISIKQAEKELGVSLPESYLALLKEHNGGYLEYPYFHIGDDKKRYGMGHMNGIHSEGFSILSSQTIIDEIGLPNNLVLLDGDYHSWIALDYRSKAVPSVVYFYEDYSEEEMRWGSVEIAPSFDIFLTKLFSVPALDPKKLKTSYGRRK